MNEIDIETTYYSLIEAEGSERSAINIDSEFEPEADNNSEEVDNQSTLSATVDKEFLILGELSLTTKEALPVEEGTY
ncbi:unnamed protein product [Clonostachys rosea f. rosea IK726]|uniref:Uncharacterized protein n=1 Tax=Clonostachys rosea f. rosea IK726 TaxID=1349383 RepID=A0ACA9TX45_BIOOC|nr:unnamed protein product [Clonostachys rosea f. rosea IK726]